MQRFIIGLLAGIAVLFALEVSRALGLLLIAVCHGLLLYEYFRLIGRHLSDTVRNGAMAVLNAIFLVMVFRIAYYNPAISYELNAAGGGTVPAYYWLMSHVALYLLAAWVFLFLFVSFHLVRNYPGEGFTLKSALFTLTSFGYIFVGLASFALLYGVGQKHFWFIPILLSWGCDSGALFTGKLIGKKPLCPRVSPKKTVEGLIGGIVTGAIALPAFLYFVEYYPACPQPAFFVKYAIIGAVIAGLGHLGDLFMSVIKREFALKESGIFLPGHGGLLDKIDSLLVVSVLSALVFL